FFGDKMERKLWAPVGAVITTVGAISIGFFGLGNFALATLGAFLIFVGIDIWVPITYAWSAESFPTRARATGFALADGVGHLGGGIGLIAVAAVTSLLLPVFGTIGIFLVVALFQAISAALAQMGPKTANRRFDEVSP
ncbi:MAG: MFS transporter, partial [Thaumarchaeota archaeon]|nr:MFS transporter [Nitrososphaerota archaeon]